MQQPYAVPLMKLRASGAHHPVGRERLRRGRPPSHPSRRLRRLARSLAVVFGLSTALLASAFILPHWLTVEEWAFAKDKGGGDKGGSDRGGADKGGGGKGGGADKDGGDKGDRSGGGNADKGGGGKGGGADKGGGDKGDGRGGASADKGGRAGTDRSASNLGNTAKGGGATDSGGSASRGGGSTSGVTGTTSSAPAASQSRELSQLQSSSVVTGSPATSTNGAPSPDPHDTALPESDPDAEPLARTAIAAAQRATRAAEEAAEAVNRHTQDGLPAQGPIRTLVTEAARDAARAAADAALQASQEASQVESAVRMGIGRSAGRQAAVAASVRAEDAALRAREAADEARDRPQWIAPPLASQRPDVDGLFGLRRATRSQSVFIEGKGRYDAEDYRGARERLSEAVLLEPDHDEARALLGWAEYFDGDYAAATITFKAALRRQPSWEGLYDGLGWSRLRVGHARLAREAFRAALTLQSDYLDALIGLGMAEYELRRYSEALGPLTIALRQLKPLIGEEPSQASRVRAKIAWSLYHRGRYQEALVAFQTGARAQYDAYLFHAGMGWCYLRLQRRGEARVAFQQSLALQPSYQDALDGLQLAGR
jgi:tetratricopeptide (TPR) repeat protein